MSFVFVFECYWYTFHIWHKSRPRVQADMRYDFRTVWQNHFYFKLSSDRWWKVKSVTLKFISSNCCRNLWPLLAMYSFWFSEVYLVLPHPLLNRGCTYVIPSSQIWSFLNLALVKLTSDSFGDHDNTFRSSLVELRPSLSKGINLNF